MRFFNLLLEIFKIDWASAKPFTGENEYAQLPPHSLQTLRRCPCSHRPLPPHSLQTQCCRLCSQMLLPPQSLHSLRCRPCSQIGTPWASAWVKHVYASRLYRRPRERLSRCLEEDDDRDATY